MRSFMCRTFPSRHSSAPAVDRFRWVAAVVLSLLAAACDHGTDPPPPPSALTVAVQTSEGTPVANVVLRLTAPGGTTTSGLTDSEGRYQFTSLAAGEYRVSQTPPLGFEAVAGEQTVQMSADRTLNMTARAVRDVTATVGPGTTDTLAVASGTYVAVQGSAGGQVSIRLQESATTGFGELDVVGTPVVLTTTAGSAASAGPAHSRQAAPAATVGVTVWQRVEDCTGASVGMAFRVDPAGGGDPLFLFADASCTTWTDPRTGRSGKAVQGTAQVPAGARFPIAVFTRDTQCTTGTARAIYRHPSTPEGGSRIPLVLIHGWQKDAYTCEWFEGYHPETETFGPLVAGILANTDLASKYTIYFLRYPTFQSVGVASEFLHQEILSRGWASNGVVLVGHSMGGLVGRGYMAAHGADAVRALITLGTPHEGSPLADVHTVESQCGSGLAGAYIFSPTAGSDDLRPGGAWISQLRDHTDHGSQVLTLAGDISGDAFPGFKMAAARCVLNGMLEAAGVADRRNDGIVPVTSAIPLWTGVQQVLTSEDHLELPGGPAAGRVRFMLGELARCLPGEPPPPVAANQFPLSGTLGRQDAGRIDVVLNPIRIDGDLVSGLTKDNFAIVEDNCLKYFDVTTDEGNIGVDIVFIQDLSGSMSDAIDGVRSSAISFAADLQARGLNVQVGSVGFSGPGSIITHPGEGQCEAIGPVHNLSSPASFVSHVEDAWYAYDGCDSPENGLEAIEYAHRNMAWRTGAARAYILITDVSLHHAGTSCNGGGPCTDQTIASIVSLVGGSSTIHAIAPASAYERTYEGGADPWLLATGTGGSRLVLPASGYVDLNELGITEAIAEVVRLTFTSTTSTRGAHRLRIRVTVDGKVAEIAPGLVEYSVHPSLQRSAP
jgi:pimeloyl-ACP methyl ester carboxylesterase